MKNYLITVIGCFVSILTFAQPSNDDCSGAINIGTLPTPPMCPSNGQGANAIINGTLVGATPGNPYMSQLNCSGPGGTVQSSPANDVWYTFTASGNHANISIHSTFANPNIAFYSGTCGTLVGRGCSVGSADSVNITINGMAPGTTYYLQVSGYPTQTGTFTLTI
ncbi:MAG TPA: hypothetical protein VNX68_00585, partial [Nitrosopumilaceae archaeon]|nr:hypothetical protein [Nitrosopumilaceae archaeon]